MGGLLGGRNGRDIRQSANHAKYARPVQDANPGWHPETLRFPGDIHNVESEPKLGHLPVRAKGGRYRDRLRGLACTTCQVP